MTVKLLNGNKLSWQWPTPVDNKHPNPTAVEKLTAVENLVTIWPTPLSST